ncbi:hypothetical protein ABKZ05_000303 [Vibrio navarrensis]
MINNIYGGLLSILWRTAQIVFWGGREKEKVLGSGFWALGSGKSERARAEEKVLGSGPLVLGKAEKMEKKVLGPREEQGLGRARAKT